VAHSGEMVEPGTVLLSKTASGRLRGAPWQQGGGTESMAALMPQPGSFACGARMKDIQDCQLFWIIKSGPVLV
jgi:hypothetical protein